MYILVLVCHHLRLILKCFQYYLVNQLYLTLQNYYYIKCSEIVIYHNSQL